MNGCSVSGNSRFWGLALLAASWLPAASAPAQWLSTGTSMGGAVVALGTDSQYLYAATSQGRVWRRPIGELVTHAGMTNADRSAVPAGSLTNYPNPCNSSTSFEFALPTDSRASLQLYDVLGRNVQTLLDLPLRAGVYRWTADLSLLPTGVYLAVLASGDLRLTRRILLIR